MKLSKKGIFFRALGKAGGFLAITLFSGTSVPGPVIFGVLVTAAFLLAVLWEYIVWRRYDYYLEDRKLRITKGVLRRQEREIPLSRIQNIDLRTNVVQRIVGVTEVGIETAGAGETEGNLKYLEREDAENLRSHIEGPDTDKEKQQESGQDTREYDYVMSRKNLVLHSLISVDSSTLFLAGTAATAAGWGVQNVLDGIALSSGLAGLLAFLLLGAAVSFNFLRNIEKYYGFRLWQTGDRLKYERGLLNRKEGTIPLEKAQDVCISENLLKRIIGVATLEIDTAGYAGQQQVKLGSEAAIPLDTRENILNYASNMEGFQVPEIQEVSPQAARRYFLRYEFLSVIGAPAVLIATSLAAAAVFLILGTAVSAAAAYIKYRSKGYGYDEKVFAARNGFWSQKTTIAPYFRIQNIVESRSILQRYLGTGSLELDIAGLGAFSRNPRAVDVDGEALRPLREEVYSRFTDSSSPSI